MWCRTQTPSTVAYLGRLLNLFPFSKVVEQKQSKKEEYIL